MPVYKYSGHKNLAHALEPFTRMIFRNDGRQAFSLPLGLIESKEGAVRWEARRSIPKPLSRKLFVTQRHFHSSVVIYDNV